MRLVTIKVNSTESAGIATSLGIIPITSINETLKKQFPTDLFTILNSGHLREIVSLIDEVELNNLSSQIIQLDRVKYGPLYRHPRKIWGIGLNYMKHAQDLLEKAPTLEPASFMKPDTTIIGHEDIIEIPIQSEKTTGEAELGIIIGKKCKNVSREDWLEVVAGFTTIIDMTAEDILRKNPRFLTRAKSFDTFFSFGPELLTPDEISNINNLRVATVINAKSHAQNVISNMTFPPDFLVSFHSKVMTLLPGDIIATGTPRAVQLHHNDVIECQIDGFSSLRNPVCDLKVKRSFDN